jgi:hypothetical protein
VEHQVAPGEKLSVMWLQVDLAMPPAIGMYACNCVCIVGGSLEASAAFSLVVVTLLSVMLKDDEESKVGEEDR